MTVAESIRTYRWQFVLVLLLLTGVYYAVVADMVSQWYEDPNYSHGFIVPLVAGYFVYQRRHDVAGLPLDPWWPGLFIILLGLAQLSIGWLGIEFFTMRSSLIVTLGGMTLYFFGRQFFAFMFLPLCYLCFMVPIPYIVYDMIAFPLKLFVTRISIAALKLMGVVVMHEGNVILLPMTTLEVADACSGIRSLISLLAVAVAFASCLKLSWRKKVLLASLAIPVAILANALRVIGTGALAQYWGARAAEGFFHEFAGMAVFVVAVLVLVAMGSWLARGTQGAR
ncbi:exosortase/archaeosortase family protein [Geomonas subterranea]|uniref:Exosortase/archaeosortase family protein n=1 Tax=Geomonas subterranea TaxID=2847989 RepID=A0ABX8LL79_9BACT|nr:exosortase A [Geomonas subterranea]QXE91681.1 exosortase/archaeosortase family protein [Geomonas subterranea]QXM10225.1 exosortase/archaeosortase family protein [Geomonas subterranea]